MATHAEVLRARISTLEENLKVELASSNPGKLYIQDVTESLASCREQLARLEKSGGIIK